MKAFILIAVLVACSYASKLPGTVMGKLTPSLPNTRVINGMDAVPHSAPYIVSLRKKGKHFCAGTIIDKDWVLTVARCGAFEPLSRLSIVAGLHQLDNLEPEKTQERVVDYAAVHESWEEFMYASPNDIALFHLSSSFVFNEYVQPAVLPTPGKIHNDARVSIYGWGMVDPFAIELSQRLKVVQTVTLTYEDCNKWLPIELFETNVCSDTTMAGYNTCTGDEGGPMVIKHQNASSELIGMVSWFDTPCGWYQFPTVHTRVSSYVEWINQKMSAYSNSRKA